MRIIQLNQRAPPPTQQGLHWSPTNLTSSLSSSLSLSLSLSTSHDIRERGTRTLTLRSALCAPRDLARVLRSEGRLCFDCVAEHLVRIRGIQQGGHPRRAFVITHLLRHAKVVRAVHAIRGQIDG